MVVLCPWDVDRNGEERMLILKVKGEEDNRDRAKYTFARSWVESVNRDGRHGTWAFEVVREPAEVPAVVGASRPDEGA